MGIQVTTSGDFSKTYEFLNRLQKRSYIHVLREYGQKGVEALRSATPVDTGKTADSWYYEIEEDRNRATVSWYNRNINKGVCIAILIQYGHGTGTGGYVQGIDYINPALKDIFQQMADECWKEVTK